DEVGRTNLSVETAFDQKSIEPRKIGQATIEIAADLIKLIRDTVMQPVVLSLKGFDEIEAESERLDFPAIFHNAAPTAATLLKLA
ncbi:hypothetical protein ACC697_38955, partial [Rhizobium ruizarguesonis]